MALWDAARDALGLESRSGGGHVASGRGVLLLQIIVLASLYIQFGWLGRQLSFPNSIGTLLWPPSGLALAALILFGTRLWPGVFLGSFFSTLLIGIDLPVSIGIASISALKAVIATVILCRLLDFRPGLDRLWDVGSLLIVGSITSAIFAALGVTALWLDDELHTTNLAPGLWIWWRGEVGGMIALAPILLLLREGRPDWSRLFARGEFWLAAILLAGACYLAFGGVTTGELQSFLAQLPYPLLVWVGARFGPRGAAVVSFPTQLIAVYATSQGVGPFVSQHADATMSLIWLYCVSLGATALAISAAVSQRDRAEDASHREATDRLLAERERELLEQRERIMREMHDGIGAQLVSVLSMVQRGRARPDEIAEGLRRALDDMRIMIDSLESRGEGLRGLLGKLRARLDPLLRRNGLEAEWWIDPQIGLDFVDPERSLHSLRIIQEAVANVIQHARARHVRIVVAADASDASTVSIEVGDDGIGGETGIARMGHGMRNMTDRAREMGGEIRFEPTHPGRRVVLRFPIGPAAD